MIAAPKRPYHSPHRGALKLQVRQTIHQTVREIVETDGLAAISFPTVARRAGVSLRTVYRHFPSRQALMEDLPLGSSQSLGPRLRDALVSAMGSAELQHYLTWRCGLSTLEAQETIGWATARLFGPLPESPRPVEPPVDVVEEEEFID